MARWKATIAYDGTNFSGWQVQPEKRTVQGELEKGLTRLHKGKKISVFGSGRTDAQVHARGQVVHFDSTLAIAPERWPYALAGVLPPDIQVRDAKVVSEDFHARFDAVAKEYRYFLHVGSERDVFQRQYVYHVYAKEFDTGAVKRALQHLEGEHDFSSFCASNTYVQNKVRLLEQVTLVRMREGAWYFHFRGEGFLYNMVRIIVGTAIEIGLHRRPSNDMARILHSKDRREAGVTAPGHGLFLWSVDYGP
ncbi:tRNA pseudouridine38-40 synthase [Geomicrobium halophilum]|uniref:tRNA pseudouridine synthase A n=1 Tax=Geomicrobium halophilum TaxID=549000 RepID=A0A841Q0U9_9BACL|nr:tRNA pseudouridine(38-40) synthase TruA [Geomicrobium halophilum]MBB6451493.1 tRNA pseudouridine38-40 synthase [Geomicrobium halophilum]